MIHIIIHRGAPNNKMMSVLEACHSSPVSGHHSGIRTAQKILQSGCYWCKNPKMI